MGERLLGWRVKGQKGTYVQGGRLSGGIGICVVLAIVLALCHECARTLSRDVVCSFCMGFVMYTRLCVDYVRSCGLKGYEEGASRCLCFVCESMPVLCVRASFIRAFSEIEPFDWGLLTPLSQQPSHGGSTYRYL